MTYVETISYIITGSVATLLGIDMTINLLSQRFVYAKIVSGIFLVPTMVIAMVATHRLFGG
jgi:hypothetical protein